MRIKYLISQSKATKNRGSQILPFGIIFSLSNLGFSLFSIVKLISQKCFGRFAFYLFIREIVYQFRKGNILKIARLNLGFIFRKKTVSIFLPSAGHSKYLSHTLQALKSNANLQIFVITTFPSDELSYFYVKFTSKIFFSHVHICPVAQSALIRKPSFAKSICFPHSLLSLFSEKSSAFQGFDYVICHTKSFYSELEAHLQQTPTQILWGSYERLIEEKEPEVEASQILIALTRSDNFNSNDKLIDLISELLIHFKVVFRPHPLDFINRSKWIEEVRDKFRGNCKFNIDDSSDIKTQMKLSRFLISDWSGTALHFAICYRKPVVMIDEPYPFPNYVDYSSEVQAHFENRLENIFRNRIAAIYGENDCIFEKFEEANQKLRGLDRFVADQFYSLSKEENYKRVLELLGL